LENGAAIGSAGAFTGARYLRGQLFGVGPTDPVTYIVVSASLASVALFATYLAARGASRLDPVVALRAEL
jgi:ABC-type antimicrobial peptide transport system permease subunit